MEEIIKQIYEIDEVAKKFEEDNKKKLDKIQIAYEKQISDYKYEIVAKTKREILKIESKWEKKTSSLKEESSKYISKEKFEIKNRYELLEKELLDDIVGKIIYSGESL